jgi:hypothetical protein
MDGVLTRRTAPVVLLLALLLAACGSSGDSADDTTSAGTGTGRGTRLVVEGVATTGGAAPTPDPNAPPPIPDPSAATEGRFSGTVTCEGRPKGAGMFATTATEVCATLAHRPDTFAGAGADDQVCAQIYGGPQHATITGTVDRRPVDEKVDRTNGCGIDRWESLQWLLGPPER